MAEVCRVFLKLGVLAYGVVVVEFVALVGGAGFRLVVDALLAYPTVRLRVTNTVEGDALLVELGFELFEVPGVGSFPCHVDASRLRLVHVEVG
ncbi:hypothetical protein U6G28_02565 [Actinomycetaceae bacterium MB13-C1-2]|nr:hypothetical protein U6G28_02565 [Actinomycetaceae bacterium MB13-C1-2]